MASLRARGTSGELRYGYQAAATLGDWVMESDGTAYRFRAVLLDGDDVWLARRPLALVVALGQVEWAWQDVEPSVDGGIVTVALARRPDVSGAVPGA